MRSRLPLTAAIGTAVALALTACGHEGGKSSAAAPAAKGGKPTVCLVMKSLGNEYFQNMQKGAVEHANQLGNVTLQAVGVQNDSDVDGQVSEIDKCVTEGAAGLVIAPADSRALIAPIKRAVSAGLKVMNIDVQLDQDALKQAGLDIPFVGPDNEAAAKQSGMVLAKALGPGGKVVILQGEPGAANAQQRTAGFMDAVKEGGLNVLASDTAHWDTDQAFTLVSNMLTKYPDVQGVLAGNDNMALGAEKAIAAAHRTGQIKIASFDDIPAIKQFLQDGSVVSTIDQFATQQAGDGIDQVLKEIGGASVTGWVKTPVQLVTKDGADASAAPSTAASSG